MKEIDKIKQMDSFELSRYIFDLMGASDDFCFVGCKEYENQQCGARCRKNLQEYLEKEVD